MKREICKKCKYFVRHYRLGTECGIYWVDCGHCEHAKGNMKKASCEYFEEDNKENERKQFEVLREIYRLNNNAKYIINRLDLLKTMIKDIKENKKYN